MHERAHYRCRTRGPVWCQTCHLKAEVKNYSGFILPPPLLLLSVLFFYYNFSTQAFPQRDWGHLFKSCNITQTISLSEKAAKIIFPQLKAIIGLWLCFEKTNACDLLCRVFVVFGKQPANKERFRKTEEGLVTKREKKKQSKKANTSSLSNFLAQTKMSNWKLFRHIREAAKKVNSGQQDVF